MIGFLPVSLFKVRFHVGSGRPYSKFDRLVLEAIGSGTSTLEDLVATFRVHRRMIVEVIVTLMSARWLVIDSRSGQFGLSQAGRSALARGTLPEDTMTYERSLHVLMDRVTGQVCPATDATFQDRRRLQSVWDSGFSIPKSDIPNSVTTGMVLPFVRVEREAWIKNIGPITIKRDNTDYVLVNVDLRNRQLTGIPKYWVPLLADILFDAAERRQTELSAAGRKVDEKHLQEMFVDSPAKAEIQWWRLRPEDVQLRLGEASPSEVITKTLEVAKGHALVAASEVDLSVFMRTVPILRSALVRGVAIDFLWGDVTSKLPDTRTQFLAQLSELGAQSVRDSVRLFKYNSQPAGFNFNLFLSSSETNWEAGLGFRPWLRESIAGMSQGCWLRISHPGMISELVRFLADAVMHDPDLRTSSTPIRLRNEADELARLFAVNQSVYNEGDIEARFIFDDQHVAASLQMLTQAGENLVAVSDELSAGMSFGFFPLLSRLLQRKPLNISLYYGAEGNANEIEAVQEFRKLGGQLFICETSKANCLITDSQMAMMTSYGLLSDSLAPTGRRAKNIGISLRHEALTTKLLATLEGSRKSE